MSLSEEIHVFPIHDNLPTSLFSWMIVVSFAAVFSVDSKWRPTLKTAAEETRMIDEHCVFGHELFIKS